MWWNEPAKRKVLQVYFVVATRKLGVPAAFARRKVELFGRHELIGAVRPARADRPGPEPRPGGDRSDAPHSVSFWDALIVQAAKAAHCSVLYTEDPQHGSVFEGLEVVDPFAG